MRTIVLEIDLKPGRRNGMGGVAVAVGRGGRDVHEPVRDRDLVVIGSGRRAIDIVRDRRKLRDPQMPVGVDIEREHLLAGLEVVAVDAPDDVRVGGIREQEDIVVADRGVQPGILAAEPATGGIRQLIGHTSGRARSIRAKIRRREQARSDTGRFGVTKNRTDLSAANRGRQHARGCRGIDVVLRVWARLRGEARALVMGDAERGGSAHNGRNSAHRKRMTDIELLRISRVGWKGRRTVRRAREGDVVVIGNDETIEIVRRVNRDGCPLVQADDDDADQRIAVIHRNLGVAGIPSDGDVVQRDRQRIAVIGEVVVVIGVEHLDEHRRRVARTALDLLDGERGRIHLVMTIIGEGIGRERDVVDKVEPQDLGRQVVASVDLMALDRLVADADIAACRIDRVRVRAIALTDAGQEHVLIARTIETALVDITSLDADIGERRVDAILRSGDGRAGIVDGDDGTAVADDSRRGGLRDMVTIAVSHGHSQLHTDTLAGQSRQQRDRLVVQRRILW